MILEANPMSTDKTPRRLLVIDEDPDFITTLRLHFEGVGYQVDGALTGGEGLSQAAAVRPDLILLSARLNDMAGLDVFRDLRDKPRTGHIPVMFTAGRNEAMMQNKILEEGAYDFIEKPVDLDILTLRVRNALRRAEREGLTEPRTGLPTARLITEHIAALDNEIGWYKIDLKIESFNVFRDLYGFVTANEALKFAGNLLLQIVNEVADPHDFVGHKTGTEEFVIITSQRHGAKLCKSLEQRVTKELESFYNFMERDQGFVKVDDGSGTMVEKPLMTAKTTVTQGAPDSSAPPPDDDVWTDAADSEQPPSSGGSPFDW
jgi:DNA-binding response OmpR family regulator